MIVLRSDSGETHVRRHATWGMYVVREVMRGPLRATLMDILDREVLPGFAARGMADQARDYMAITIERFENPFLDHRLSDISQNHAAKIGHRITAFLDWSRRSMTEAPRLHAISQSARDFAP